MNGYRRRVSRASRRGSVYVLVLASAATLAVIGVAAATLTRTQIHADALDRDAARADRMALSAVHAGIAWINQTPDWRERQIEASNNGEPGDFGHFRLQHESAGSECKWWIDDPAGGGGALNPKPGTPVRVVGLGRSGKAQRVLTAVLESDPAVAFDMFRCAVHAGGSISVADSKAHDGPISSNGTITVNGTVSANIEANTFKNSGTHIGDVTQPAPTKSLPTTSGAASPFEILSPLARLIDFSSIPGGKIDEQLLSPSHNPFGMTQAEGIYRINIPPNGTLEILNSRVLGTLVLQLGTDSKVLLKEGVLCSPAMPDLPAIVALGRSGEVTIENSHKRTISESSIARNLNPSGAPYAGETDSDTTDAYPSLIQGLVYVGGGASLLVKDEVRIFGCVIVEGEVILENAFIRASPAMRASPPRGFDTPGHAMRVVPGSWNQPTYEEVEGSEPNAGVPLVLK